MKRYRKVTRDVDIARGPGRLAEAMCIDGKLDGVDLCGGRGALWLGAAYVRQSRPGQLTDRVTERAAGRPIGQIGVSTGSAFRARRIAGCASTNEVARSSAGRSTFSSKPKKQPLHSRQLGPVVRLTPRRLPDTVETTLGGMMTEPQMMEIVERGVKRFNANDVDGFLEMYPRAPRWCFTDSRGNSDRGGGIEGLLLAAAPVLSGYADYDRGSFRDAEQSRAPATRSTARIRPVPRYHSFE